MFWCILIIIIYERDRDCDVWEEEERGDGKVRVWNALDWGEEVVGGKGNAQLITGKKSTYIYYLYTFFIQIIILSK